MKSLLKCQKIMAHNRKFIRFSLSSKIITKLIGIDLSRQTNANIPQQTYLTIKLAEDDG